MANQTYTQKVVMWFSFGTMTNHVMHTNTATHIRWTNIDTIRFLIYTY